MNKTTAIWIGIAFTIAGVIAGYGRLCGAVERCEEDVQSNNKVIQSVVDKFYTAQMEMNERMYEHILEEKGGGD